MTEQERYTETLLFGNPDKIPFSPGGPRESTLAQWYKQGLPEGADFASVLYDIIGMSFEPESGQKSRKYPEVTFDMMPKFEEKVLEHKDGHYVVQDWSGAVVEISDMYDFTYLQGARDFVTRKWHKFPVENREDWHEMRRRYDANAPGRYGTDFEAVCRELKERDHDVSIGIPGPFWQLREWCGLENLCFMMADEPGFVHEMIEFWSQFVIDVLEPVLTNIVLDSVMISEDMAYKQKSMISPHMTREFILPVYNRWIPRIKKSGCKIVSIDSDGYIGELIPLWIEAGINCTFPIEVAAGNDIVKFRKLYGKSMAYVGGIDKRAIAAGGDAMQSEVMRVVPPLLEDGGYIPSCDHSVPPDISWPDFVDYSRLLAKLTGWI